MTAHLVKQLEAVRTYLAAARNALIEEECQSDCPPEWTRCGICRSRQSLSLASRYLETAITELSDE
jgi:hypothetical protein